MRRIIVSSSRQRSLRSAPQDDTPHSTHAARATLVSSLPVKDVSAVTSTLPKSAAFWLWKPVRWLAAALRFLVLIGLVGWATLAIYYSNLPSAWGRVALAVAFLVFAVWALWIARTRKTFLVLAGVYVLLLVWWMLIPASHERAWRPEVAVMPRAIVDGDRIRFTGVRNFEYRSVDDFTPRYEEREVSLAHLTGVDFFISYWHEGPVGHTFVSFIFDNAPPLSISIETRPEMGEGFDPVASLFKQFELIYVVGDERDLVRVRTNYRDEEVFLYHTAISPEFARRLLLIYVERINELADRAGVLPSAEQQLHHQHHPLRQCRGTDRPLRLPPHAERAHRPLHLRRRRRRHHDCPSMSCAAARASPPRRRRQAMVPIFPTASARACPPRPLAERMRDYLP